MTRIYGFNENKVLLDGKIIYAVEGSNASDTGINLLGISNDARTIYVGSGQCCDGPVSVIKDRANGGETPDFQLIGVVKQNFNVYDMTPVMVDPDVTGFASEEAVLTTGYGCSGAGVNLVDPYSKKNVEIVPKEEFSGLWQQRIQNWIMPSLDVSTGHSRTGERDSRVTLNLLSAGYRLKAGKTRDPNLPSILVDGSSQEFHVSRNVWVSADLTSRLRDIGVNIESTLEANRGYTRINK